VSPGGREVACLLACLDEPALAVSRLVRPEFLDPVRKSAQSQRAP
jgi:hypothetical protein